MQTTHSLVAMLLRYDQSTEQLPFWAPNRLGYTLHFDCILVQGSRICNNVIVYVCLARGKAAPSNPLPLDLKM